MSTTDTYNGWTNRETWACALWLGNDEGLYDQAREIVTKVDDAAEMGYRIFADDAIRDWVTDELFDPEMLAANEQLRMMHDEVGSLWRVDWREVADSFRDE